MQALRAAAASRIAKQTEGIPPEEVEKIVLHSAALSPEMLLPFTHLTQLTLVSMKPMLKSIHALFAANHFTSLILLDVSDNRISIPSALPQTFPSLRRLLMANNGIKEIKEVQYLSEAFPSLEVLDLSFNEVSTEKNFNDMFHLFPKLIALDSRRRDGEEVIVGDIDESTSEITSDEEEGGGEETEDEEDKNSETNSSCSSSSSSSKMKSVRGSDSIQNDAYSNEDEKDSLACDLPPQKRMKVE